GVIVEFGDEGFFQFKDWKILASHWGKTSNAQRLTSNAHLRKKTLIRFVDLVAGDDERDLLDGIVFAQKFRRRLDCDPRGVGDRIAIRAAADRRKRDRPHVIGDRDLQRISIAIREYLW